MALTNDVKTSPIWDVNKSAEEMLQDCSDWIKANAATLTDDKIAKYNDYVAQLTAMKGTQMSKVELFFAAREVAYSALAEAQATAKQELADLWQAGENNDHTIPV